MRIGYGYKRAEADFAHANVQSIWIDHPGTERNERTWVLRRALRRGYTLVLLSPGDLGAGGEIPMLRAELADRGVEIEICPADKLPAKRGPKPAFAPDPEQDAQISALWHSPDYSQAYVLRRASEIMGMEVRRWHLTHRYKARSGSLKKKP